MPRATTEWNNLDKENYVTSLNVSGSWLFPENPTIVRLKTKALGTRIILHTSNRKAMNKCMVKSD
jgi:hypothetical protein